MKKRELSRKRAAETEKESGLNMEDKDATPVEEVEPIIIETQGDKAEPNRVTESVDMKSIMEYLKQSHGRMFELNENNNKNLEKLKEELSENNNKNLEILK